jgi:hypothetical protein
VIGLAIVLTFVGVIAITLAVKVCVCGGRRGQRGCHVCVCVRACVRVLCVCMCVICVFV